MFRMVAPLTISAAMLLTTCLPNENDARQANLRTGPLTELPHGWVFLTHSYIDIWTGVYHDSISGAYVRFGGGRDLETEYWGWDEEKGDQVVNGTIDHTNYRAVMVTNPRGRMINRIEEEFGQPIAELPDVARILPPESCSLLELTFSRQDGSFAWRFTSGVCNRHQEERVRGLLPGQMRIDLQKESPGWNEQPTDLQETDLDRVAVGMNVEELQQALGFSGDSLRISTDGFTVVYYVLSRSSEAAKKATFVFNRSQVLVRQELE